jgi:hypothetical protein
MSDFFAAVASASSQDPQSIKEVLDRYRIQPWVAPSASPAMQVQEVAFEGKKPPDEVEFEFKWELGSGVWALSSVDNDVGKSTVLQVIRWLLSGRDHVNKKTRAMIDSAMLRFKIGSESIVVEVQGGPGEEVGTVSLGDTQQPITAASFEATMDAIMLDRLGLPPVARWQKFQNSEDGQPTTRGWTAFIPALFLPAPSSSAVLGDTAAESSTLLQVFLGLPWASTSRQIDVALKQLAMEARDEKRRADRDSTREAKVAEEAARRVATAEERLAAISDYEKVEQELQEATTEVAEATKKRLLAQRILATRKEEVADIERALVVAKRNARVLEETEAAGSIFSELKAEVCPRCELDIDADRRQREAEQNVCMVCGRTHGPPELEAQHVLSEAKSKVEELEALDKESRSTLSQASTAATGADEELQQAEDRLRKAAAAIEALKEQQQARVELAEAQGEVAVLGRMKMDPDEDEAPPNLDEEILKAAKRVAEERIKDTDLFKRLNDEILKVVHRFGMTDVDSARINRASHLPVKKGEVQENFSDLSASEKLRLRIATVIALLRVTSVSGPGRHPGLLVIDSPAAEEVADPNLDQMLQELVSLAEEIPRLQVFIATTRTSAVEAAIPAGQVKFVPAGHYLW